MVLKEGKEKSNKQKSGHNGTEMIYNKYVKEKSK